MFLPAASQLCDAGPESVQTEDGAREVCTMRPIEELFLGGLLVVLAFVQEGTVLRDHGANFCDDASKALARNQIKETDELLRAPCAIRRSARCLRPTSTP